MTNPSPFSWFCLYLLLSSLVLGKPVVGQTLIVSFPHGCPSGFPTGVFYDENRCTTHIHCSGGLNYTIDSTGAASPFYFPYPDSNFSHTDMQESPSGNMYMIRDLAPLAYGPGAELWEIDLDNNSSQFVSNLNSIVSWEPWGLAIEAVSGDLFVGEVNDPIGGRIQFVTRLTTSGTFLDTILTISQMDSLGINAGSGGLAIDPLGGELIVSGWAGTSVGKLFAVDPATKAISLFFDTGFTDYYGPTGISFSSGGDFVISSFNGIFFYDHNSDLAFDCLSSVLSGQSISLQANQEADQMLLSWTSVFPSFEWQLFHRVAGATWEGVFFQNIPAGTLAGKFAHIPLHTGMQEYQLIGIEQSGQEIARQLIQVPYQAPLPSIRLSPNPTSGLIRITGLSTATPAKLYSLSGQQLWEGKLVPEQALDLGNFAAGAYVLWIGQKQKQILLIQP